MCSSKLRHLLLALGNGSGEGVVLPLQAAAFKAESHDERLKPNPPVFGEPEVRGAHGRELTLGRGNGFPGAADNLGEGRRFPHGQIGQLLSVKPDPRSVEAVDEV